MTRSRPALLKESVLNVLSKATQIQSHLFLPGEALEREIARLPAALAVRVFGQKRAIDTVVESVSRSYRAGLSAAPTGPRGTILLTGPSGTGKTETALSAFFYC